MTTRLRSLAVTGALCAALSGCGAAHAVAGIHDAPAAATTVPAVGADQGGHVLDRVFTAAGQAQRATGSAATAARAVAYTGPALTAEIADAKLSAVAPQIQGDAPAIAPERARLLAVSQGPGYPRFLIAQTVPAQGSLPVLHLLSSPDARTPYRVEQSATMLPNAAVRRFADLDLGSALVRNGHGLAADPQDLLTAYAKGLAFPQATVKDPPYAVDGFAGQLRAAAAAQARGVSAYAGFTQIHRVQPGSVHGIRQANGGALVFGVIERTDTFTVKKAGSSLKSPRQFSTLVPGRTRLRKQARMTTLEFVIFQVPKGSGQATLVAASEHLVAAAGS